MRHATPRPFSKRLPRLVLLLALAFGLTAAADAWALPGVGGLAKKAKKKAAEAAGAEQEEAVDDKTVVFDEVILELTPARVDAVLTGCRKASAAAAGRPALVGERSRVADEQARFHEKHEEEIRETQGKRDEADVCRHDGIQAMVNEKMMRYSQTALTDKARLDKFAAIAAKYNAASAGGDTAATKAAQAEMAAIVMPTREDTMSVYAKCPPKPPTLPSEIQLEKYGAQLASLDERIRKVDESVAAVQAQQGGMKREQFAMAHERIQMYLAWRNYMKKKSGARGFTSEEIEAMEKRLEELQKADCF